MAREIPTRRNRESAAELGENPLALSGDVLDVTDAEAFAQALHHFAGHHGRLDVLLNNAGILSVGDFESIDTVRHALIVDINLKGVINGCHAALPWLRHTPDSRVINLASASAIYGTPGYASYSATKFVQMTGKISPRACGRRSDANNAPKAACAGGSRLRNWSEYGSDSGEFPFKR